MRRSWSVADARAQLVPLAGAGDGSGARLRGEAMQGGDRLGAAHLVGDEAHVLLEVRQGALGGRPEDAVDPAGVEPERAESELELGDVVAAHHRGGAGRAAGRRARSRPRPARPRCAASQIPLGSRPWSAWNARTAARTCRRRTRRRRQPCRSRAAREARGEVADGRALVTRVGAGRGDGDE